MTNVISLQTFRPSGGFDNESAEYASGNTVALQSYLYAVIMSPPTWLEGRTGAFPDCSGIVVAFSRNHQRVGLLLD